MNVPHRHTVFTVPKELRKFYFADRKKLNDLSTNSPDEKVMQKLLMDLMLKWFLSDQKVKQMKDARGAAKYIGRYKNAARS
ncbi:hypothetical protein [Cohnella sp. REN36]|uniref:hypothetical protein n=1 Tax=Cohnella sp. REN36 TaxID=2887347 RepID=UPI001D14BE35|nr:hypothetical protein [Cohnella sp. REN36]MCC3372091.1 hypothetical protein [Cohnella sp. REN36]